MASSTIAMEIKHRLRNVGVLDYFSAVSGGDEVPRGKPDPAVYELAAKRLGVSPDACLAFEDSENGVAAATAAGMQVVMVPDLRPPSAAAAERSFYRLNTLHEALEYVPLWFGSYRCASPLLQRT